MNRVTRLGAIALVLAVLCPSSTLASEPPLRAGDPSWSPDAQRIAFDASSPGQTSDIYVVNVHGTGLTNLTSPSLSPGQTGVAGDNLRCDWSPKANAIAFASTRHDPDPLPPDTERNEEIYVMNAD